MEQKKLDRLVSIAEILSALAVIVALIYAVTEYRRANTLDDSDVNALLFDRMTTYNELMISTPGLAEIVLAVRNGEALTAAQKERYIYLNLILYSTWETAFDYSNIGVFNKEWDGWNDYFTDYAVSHPDWLWPELEADFKASFGEHVVRSVEVRKAELEAANRKPQVIR